MNIVSVGEQTLTATPLPSLAQALHSSDAELTRYVIQHLPRGKIYSSVSVSSLERSFHKSPPKIYRVITLSLNRCQGIASIMEAISAGCGFIDNAKFVARINDSELKDEILNRMKGVLNGDHQKVKDAKVQIEEIRLLINKENEQDIEVELVEAESVLSAFKISNGISTVVTVAYNVLSLAMQYLQFLQERNIPEVEVNHVPE